MMLLRRPGRNNLDGSPCINPVDRNCKMNSPGKSFLTVSPSASLSSLNSYSTFFIFRKVRNKKRRSRQDRLLSRQIIRMIRKTVIVCRKYIIVSMDSARPCGASCAFYPFIRTLKYPYNRIEHKVPADFRKIFFRKQKNSPK